MGKQTKNSSGNRLIAGYDTFTNRIRSMISGTVAEMKRCTWPSRPELLESTVLVVVAVLLLGLFVAGVDEVARIAISLITLGKING